jgi:hypothetical protein
MTMQSWIDNEPGARACFRQIVRLLRRGFRRLAVTLAATLLLATLVVARFAIQKHVYAPRVVLRVVETDRDPISSTRPRHDLAVYIREAVWTDESLLDLVRSHGLYPGVKDPRAALDAFRRDIEVEVSQNYFVQERSATDPARSARVVVRFRSVDPATAMAVTRALAALIVDHELAGRDEQTAWAHADVERDLAMARDSQLALRAEIAATQNEINAAPSADPRLQVRLVSLLGSLEVLGAETTESERRELALSMGAAVERQRIGMRFTVVSDGDLPVAAGLGLGGLGLVGLISLMLGLPFVAVSVGAIGWKGGPGDDPR